MCGRASATHRSVAGLLALLLVLLPFGRAEAASRKPTKERVLILRVESTQLDDAARRSLTDALADSAQRYKHYDLVLSKVDLVEEMFEFECTEAGVDCLSKIGRKHKVDKVIYSEVSKDGNGKLEWSMRVVGLKPVPRVEQSTRQQLEGADAAKLAERSLLVLIGPIDLPARGEASLGTLAVRLAGGGVALVYVDDNLLGRTSVGGLTAQMAAGRYRLRVVRAGYREFQTIVVVTAEKTTEIAVTLELAPAPTRPPPGAPGTEAGVTSKWWFWTAIGVGVAAVGVGIWAATRGDDGPGVGNAAFSFDSTDAHRDPVFSGQ